MPGTFYQTRAEAEAQVINWLKNSKLLSPLRIEIGVDASGLYFVEIIRDGMKEERMADEGKNTMSLAGFREIIGTQPNPALVIWSLVADYIEETENRVIDAEFAKTEAENKLAALSVEAA